MPAKTKSEPGIFAQYDDLLKMRKTAPKPAPAPDNLAAHRLRKIFRLIHPAGDVRSTRTIHALLKVSMSPGTSTAELAKEIRLSIPAAHRAIAELSARRLIRTTKEKKEGSRWLRLWILPDGTDQLNRLLRPLSQP